MNWFDRENERICGVPSSRYPSAMHDNWGAYLEEVLLAYDRLRAENEEMKQQQEAVARDAWEASYRCLDMDGTQELSFEDYWASRAMREGE